MKSSKIIAIEGIDGCGKTMQFRLLKNKLSSMGKSFLELSFPVYESLTGIEIGNMLSGKFDVTANNVDCKSMALWYAVDRLLSFKKIDFNSVDFLLLNRYTLSNAVYQGLRNTNEDSADFAEWVFDLEFNQLKLPKPDLYFVLDVHHDVSKINVSKKGFRNYIGTEADVYEKSSDMMKNARDLYIKYSSQIKNIDLIDCMEGERMKKPQVIHETIINYLYENKFL
jgi:dTMP kinase